MTREERKIYNKIYSVKNRKRINEWNKRWRNLKGNKTRLNKRMKKQMKELKKQIVNHYGGGCECCGEKQFEFLSIDHKDGGGQKHRKELGFPRGGRNFYRWIIKNNYPENLGILCFNCNLAKGLFGVCPHEKKRRLLANLTKKDIFTKRD